MRITREVAERPRTGIAALSFPGQQGETITVTSSLGIASFHDNLPTLDRLLDYADQALYCAKSGGRNRVMVWSASSQSSAGKDKPE